MKNNKIATIYGYGYDGEGICRSEGKVTFLPFVIAGEKVEFNIEKETSSFSRGKLVKIISPSEKRELPKCSYFTQCGGCTYQHMNYFCELEIKKELFSSHLKKAGYSGAIQLTPSNNRYGYRNKIKLFLSDGKIGLKCRRSGQIVDIKNCPLSSAKINVTIGKIRSFIKARNLYDIFSQIIIREEDGQVLVNFYKKKDRQLDYLSLYLDLGKSSGIFESFKNKTRYILGLKQISKSEFGLTCSFNPTTFHQVNNFVMEKLYEKVLELASGNSALNCYSGGGVLSGILAKKFKHVVGIELGDSEHNDAQNFKENNHLENLLNIHGDCSKVIPTIKDNFDIAVLDPPKAGMDKLVCDTLNQSGIEKIIYISCDSATMARDVSRMNNYAITYAHLFDMFATTGEYETLVLLEKGH